MSVIFNNMSYKGSAPGIVTSGLVANWNAGNTMSYSGAGLTWYDLSGNGNIITLVDGPTYSLGSLVFDGIANKGHGPTSIKWSPNGAVGYQTMTIEVWIKSSDNAGNYFSKPWNGSGEYNIRITPAFFSLTVGTPTSTASLAIDSSVYNGSWHQVSCWMDGTNMGYYLDGNKFSASQAHSLTGSVPTSGDSNLSLCIMSLYPYASPWAGNASFSINGNMAVCKVYNRVLSANEVNQNFNALRGIYGI
jgi:hypothetical protein